MYASSRIYFGDLLICFRHGGCQLQRLLRRRGRNSHIYNTAVRLARCAYHLLNIVRSLGIFNAQTRYGMAHCSPCHKMDKSVRHICGRGHVVVRDGAVTGTYILFGLVVDYESHCRGIGR